MGALLFVMNKISNHKLFIPTLLFLVVAISGLTLPIHHVHPIEVATPVSDDHHSDNHRHGESETTSDVPSTYHEVHFVKLLSNDNFSTSNRNDISIRVVQFLIIIPGKIEFLDSPSSETISFSLKEPSPPPPQDKCVLFCSFLI